MTAYHQIFVRTDNSEPQLVADVGTAAGCSIKPVEPLVSTIAYGCLCGNSVIEIEMTHEFEEDFGMRFADYPIIVTIRDLGNDKAREEQTARALFSRLIALGGYRGLLVFNLQRKLIQQ